MTGAVQRSTRTRRLLSIGEVLAELQPDFSDLTHSKVRFLEDRGLVEPERTAAGYRKFSPADVARLRLVLELQRDHYWPLKKIGEYLDQLDRGVAPELPGGSPRPARLLPPSGTTSTPSRRPPAPGCAATSWWPRRASTRRCWRAWRPTVWSPWETQGYYDADDLEVARTAGELAGYGIEPRHLRAFRTAADREIGLVEQVTSPLRHHRGTGSHARADELAREISALCLRLHATLVRAALEG